MLNELLDALNLRGTDFESLERDFTISNCYCIKVSQDGLEDIYIKDGSEMKNLELKEFFRTRIFYSENIGKNKEIDKRRVSLCPKSVISNSQHAVIFNFNTVANKLPELKKAKRIEENSTLSLLIERVILDYYEALNIDKSLISSNVKKVAEKLVNENSLGYKVCICSDLPLEKYKEKYEKYLTEKLFDDKKGKVFERGEYEKYKMISSFSGINSNKPLLKRVGLENTNNVMYEAKEGLEIFKLSKHMKNNFRVQESISGLLVEYDVKDKVITKCETNPYINKDDEKVNILLKNHLDLKMEEIKIVGYSGVINSINKYIDFTLSKPNKEEKIGTLKILRNKYISVVDRSFKEEKEDKKVFYGHIVNKKAFKRVLEKLMNDAIKHNILNKRFAYTVNLKIVLEDYFLEKNRGKVLVDIKESFREKILNPKIEEIEKREEVMFAAGQLAKHLCGKTGGDNYHKLIARYSKSDSAEKVLKLLQSDREKYSFKIQGRREERIHNLILTYIVGNSITGKLNKEDKVWFMIGLTNKDMFFEKNQNKN